MVAWLDAFGSGRRPQQRMCYMNISPNFSLDGTVALVTGARGGIGQALCSALSGAGAKVIASGRGEPSSTLNADSWMLHDVTSAADWSRIVTAIRERYGRLDCLINNAGLSMVQSIGSLAMEDLRRVFSVNVESVLLSLQASMPLLRESGKHRFGGSSVVNISSVAGLRGVPLNAAYSASKGAVTLLSKSAAKEFAMLEYPVRVNTVHPGRTDTRMMDSILSRYNQIGATPIDEARAAKLAINANIPLNRIARPDEIAGAVVYLCSTAASYVTGSELVVDGGFNA